MKELTKGTPWKIIVMFAMPIMFGNILQRVYNMTDSKIVSMYISPEALAAVGATTVISNLLIGFVNSLTQGFGIIIAKCFGADAKKELRRYVAGTIMLTAFFTIALMLAGTIFLRPFLIKLNTPADILDDSVDYLRIIILGMVFVSLYNMISNVLRAVGDSRRPLICLIVSVVLNVFFDLLFICVFKLGIKGAAYATVLAQAISCASSGWFLLFDYKQILPKRDEWRLTGNHYYEMLTAGLSMGFMGCLVNIGSVILQSALNKLGTNYITAQTTGRKIFDLLMVIIFSIGFAMTTYVSQNEGAGKRDRVHRGIRDAIIIDTILTTAIIIVTMVLGKPLMRWLASTNNAVIVDNALLYLRTGVFFFYVLGPLFILRCSLQGMGRKIVPMVSSMLELLMKLLFAMLLVPAYGYIGIVYTEPISWIVMIIPLVVVYLRVYLSYKKEVKVSNNEVLE